MMRSNIVEGRGQTKVRCDTYFLYCLYHGACESNVIRLDKVYQWWLYHGLSQYITLERRCMDINTMLKRFIVSSLPVIRDLNLS